MPPRSREHEREPRVLDRATPPPGRHDLVDAGRGDLRHLLVDDGRVVARVRPARRVEARVDVVRRPVPVLVPVLPRAVVRRRPVPGVVEDRDRSGARRARARQNTPMPAPRPGGAAARAYPLAHGGQIAITRLRQRAQPRVPARAARPHRGRRLLGVARHDARARAGSDPGTCPHRVRGGLRARCAQRATPPSASSTTSASPRRTRRSRPPPTRASSSCSSTSRTARGGHRPLPPGVGRRVPARARGAARARARASGSRRTPCARARATGSTELGRYAAAEGLPLHVHADEQPREIEECLAEHGMRPIELLADTGCLTERTTVVHATHADGRELDLLGTGRRARLRVPDDRGESRRRLPAGRAACCTAASASASAPTRTCASTRSRSCASSTGSRAARRAAATSSPSTRCSRSAPTKARRHSASTPWPSIEIDVEHPQLRGVDDPLGALVAVVLGRRRRVASSPRAPTCARRSRRRSARRRRRTGAARGGTPRRAPTSIRRSASGSIRSDANPSSVEHARLGRVDVVVRERQRARPARTAAPPASADSPARDSPAP